MAGHASVIISGNPDLMDLISHVGQLSQLIKAAQAGDEVIIANRGEPVAQLVPVAAANREGSFLQWLRDNPLPAYAQRTHAEIEATIQAEREAWD